ncbi:MAG: chromosome segregation protein SMC [Oligoflexia bacterium]|nr:chromosome segregation protein SMC [Oligoflexia bacterium]
MKIKKLELLGFKSFKDKTVINFDHGITGIVGPNGCGKSNIVDALLWVMGEQSAKHLRGSSMEDVIFSGSQNFAPLGMAEVSLTLENDGGPFPAKWAKNTELMITRRLHRSGESEYFINKEEARLKDIVDIFMDTGAGSKGFSIIEQGQIGKIITAKPEDRRTLIEEAAGITKFKVRKRESQRKLESTEQNLVRLNDIIGELKRQLESLQRQAKRAERYKEIKTQAQDLDLWISAKKYEELSVLAQQLTSSLEEKKLSEQEAQTRLATLTADLQNLKLELLEHERKVTAEQGAFFELQSEIQRKESDIKLLNFEIESTKRNEEVTRTLQAEVNAREEILSRDLDQTKAQLTHATEELETLQKDSLTKTEKSLQAQLDANQIDENITQNRRELISSTQSLTAVEVKKAALTQQNSDLKSRLESLTAVYEELRSKDQEFMQARTKAYNALESQRQMQLSIMKDVENFQENLNNLKEEVSQKRNLVESLKDEHNKVASRLYGLEAVSSNFEGLQEGVRNVMMWQRERLQPLADGGFELVADVIEVPREYELAMEAALGDRLQTVLSMEHSRSLRAVDILKEKKGGRGHFLSADLLNERPEELNTQLVGEQGVRGLLTDLVKCPDRHQKVLAQIMDGVVVVDSLRTALKLRSQYSGYTFVTAEGDVLNRDGSLTGGSSESADSGILRTKREIKELSLLRDEASGKLALAIATLEKVEQKLASVSKDLEAAQKQSFEQEILIHDRKKDLERAEFELKNVSEALKRQVREVEVVQNQLNVVSEQLLICETTINDLNTKKIQLEGQIAQNEQILLGLKSQLSNLSLQATEAQVRVAAKEQAVESLKSQLSRLEASVADVQNQLLRMKDDSVKNSSTLETLVVQVEQAKADFNTKLDAFKAADLNLKVVRDQFEIKSNQVRELEIQSGQLQSTKNTLQNEMADAQLKASQADLNKKYLADQILERYMLSMDDVVVQFANREGNLEEAQATLDDLRDKIKKIGEVNLTAIQEYEELSTRYEFLTKQQQDLLGAIESLRKVIDRINRICHRRFRETFEAVNERFKKVFPVLFGGGEAQLILLEDPESGEPGVEIMARPPGKKLQSVTLLSGGEKALTAVSLIFAIFLFKPSPFCLLDEVDAPLDDANVYRFNDLVREMAKRSQIILVTHNKHTMEINNTLYGVTMEDPGVSKMVSVKLN